MRQVEEVESAGRHALIVKADLEIQPPVALSFIVIDSNTHEEGGTVMGMLRVISKRCDDRVQWNEQDALAGDTEALAANREAERIFAQERTRDATAYRIEAGKPAERVEQFDQQVEQIIMVPRVAGR